MLGVINVTDCVFSEHKNMLKNLTYMLNKYIMRCLLHVVIDWQIYDYIDTDNIVDYKCV